MSKDIIDGDFKDFSETEISPYDSSYPIKLLQMELRNKIVKAQSAAAELYKAVTKVAPQTAQIKGALQKGCRYVVDATEETLKAIEKGELKFEVTNSGKMTAQLKLSNGHFGEKLPIKKEDFRKGLDLEKMASALQMQALQEQIQEIANQINVIEHSVKDVIQGQQNDRIALYYSGLALFLEAKKVSDPAMKNLLLAQAIRSLSDSIFQLSVTLNSDIKYLENKEYESERGKKTVAIDERMQQINKAFEVIHQASLLKAGIYCTMDEIPAMTTALNEYSYFIEDTIVKNAGLLAQCDVNDSGNDEGLWEKRSKLKLDVNDFAKQIENKDKVFYIGLAEDEDGKN